jgi:hypothetical protein
MYMNLVYEKIYNLKVYMHFRFCMQEHFDLITNWFKYKCETYQVFIHPSKTYSECKIQFMSNICNTFKINDSIHLQILII